MDYRPYISILEPQNGVYVATSGCASFSLIHELEIDLNLRMAACGIPQSALSFLSANGYLVNGLALLSTRYETVMSGTQQSGNTDVNTNVALDDDGAAPRALYDFDMSARQPVDELTRDAYFVKPSGAVIAAGKGLLGHFTPSHFSIGTDHESIRQALQKHPVRIFVGIAKGWNNQVIVDDTGAAENHAVLVVDMDQDGNYIVQDTFKPYIKTLRANFKIYAAFQTYLTPQGAHAMYSKVVRADGKTFGVRIATPNGDTIIYATSEDQWKSWSQPTSYQINTVNADGSTNWSTADCTKLPF